MGMWGLGVRRWDMSRLILAQLLATDTDAQVGMTCFQVEVDGLPTRGKRATVRSLMRVVVAQKRAMCLSDLVKKVLRSYLGPLGRWRGYLTLQLQKDALEVFGVRYD